MVAIGLSVRRTADAPVTMGREIELAFEAGDMAEVLRLVKSQQVLPNDTMFFWRAGLAAEAEKDLELAIGYLDQAVAYSTDEELTSSVLLTKARVQEDLFRFHDALATLHSIPFGAGDDAADDAADGTDTAQSDRVVHRRLAELLDRMGRRYEANFHHLALVKAGEHQVEDLIWLANRQDPVVDETLEKILNGSLTAKDAYRLSRALIHVRSGQLLDAEQLLRIEISESPEQVEAHAILGLVMTDLGKFEQLGQWRGALPEAAVDHPDVWFALGSWAEAEQQQELAVRCYHQAVSLDVSFQPAIFRLLRLLDGQQVEGSLRTQLTRHQADLQRYQQLCKRIFFEGPSVELVDEAIGVSQDLFRFHEAIGWLAIKQSTLSGFGDVDIGSRQLIKKLTQAIDQNQAEANHPVRKLLQQVEFDGRWAKAFSTFFDQLSMETTSAIGSAKKTIVSASFDDQASQFGIAFAFDKGTDSESGLMIQQSMGGGVAVVDFDQDGWPDLFLPQGVSPQRTDSDSLLRNRMAQGFDEVEKLAGCVDAVYSHGAAVGDVNTDGFPDLLVANQGGNHLYVNNGDGTFDNASGLLDSTAWTISGMIADLNGDSFPDLFEANYLSGELPFTKVCIDQKLQLPRTCPPEQFEGQPNQCYLNDAEGGFQKVSLESGLDQLTGKSLGLVAADFEGTGALEVFVANDQVANEFLQIDDSASSLSVVFRDTAALKGIAYNGTGEALACMGVASADVNHDGYLDLFVTNFYRQENTLYTNLAGTGFHDSTAQAKLRAPSLAQLGFGTQFLDANLDSEPDILVANGHLDDFTDRNIPYAMHSQVLMNTGDSQFVAQSYEVSGPWFQQAHLARGIAKLDWNRDGREDVAVSQLNEQVALLTNTTAAAGHFVCFNLIGQHSSRDAVGANVQIDFADSSRWMQVTAGDGYASSNQKQLTFGLGKETVVNSITITWPSGERQSFENVQADQCYFVVEHFDRLLVNPR